MKEPEISALERVRGPSGSAPGAEVGSVVNERKIGRDEGVDGLVRCARHGRAHALVVEVRPNGAPVLSVPGSIGSKAMRRDRAGRPRPLPAGLIAMIVIPCPEAAERPWQGRAQSNRR